MKLFGTLTSPFVRKVRIAACEVGQAGSIEFVVSSLTPIHRDLEIVAANPSGRVPTLILDDGAALYDSRVICRYLDSLSLRRALYPQDGSELWDTLRREAMGDGLLEPALALRYELALRPEALRWMPLAETLRAKVESALDAAEASPLAAERFDAGDISLFCGLSYLDFRFPGWNWREFRPRLSSWNSAISSRESVRSSGYSA